MLKDITDLINAIAHLLWPVLAFVIFFSLKGNIIKLLPRVKKLKIAGQEIELDEAIKKLEVSVEKSAQEVPELTTATDTTILQSTSDPKMGIVAVSIELEKVIKNLYASMGMLNERSYITQQQALEIMIQKGYIPKHTAASLEIFRKLRNAIVHGKDNNIDEKEVIRVLDTGMMLLQTLKSIPHETNIVYLADIDLYTDEACKNLVTDAKGLMLETISPGGVDKNYRIFPTTRMNYYVKGKQVSWEWNLGRIWQRTWYIDPKTKKAKIAWDSSGDFIGRHIEEV